MKRIFCRICGEEWSPWKEAANTFMERHVKMHNIAVPYGTEFKSMEEYIDALRKWLNKYFDLRND